MTAYVQDAIVVLGDSITQGSWEPLGFSQRLAVAYQRKLDVINRGFSGYNTNWIIPVLEQILPKQREQSDLPKLRLLTVFFGANDACKYPSVQHVPLQKFSENLSRIINMLRSPTSAYYSPNTQILLLTPPPINIEQWKVARGDPSGESDREFDVTAQYAQAARDVGNSEKVPVVDVFSALWDAAGQKEEGLVPFLSDGLHLTGEGYTIVYDQIVKAITEHYPELQPDRLKEVFIPWDQVPRTDFRGVLGKKNID